MLGIHYVPRAVMPQWLIILVVKWCYRRITLLKMWTKCLYKSCKAELPLFAASWEAQSDEQLCFTKSSLEVKGINCCQQSSCTVLSLFFDVCTLFHLYVFSKSHPHTPWFFLPSFITFAFLLLYLLFSEKWGKTCNLPYDLVLQLHVFLLKYTSLNVAWDVSFMPVLFHNPLFQETKKSIKWTQVEKT